MADDKKAGAPDKRQMITAGLLAVVLLVVVWQIWGLFGSGGGGGDVEAAQAQTIQSPALREHMVQPKKVAIKQSTELTEREKELMKMQQELQAKYTKAVNELAMLKIQRDIADANKKIMQDRLDTVKAQKDLVDMLTTPGPTQGDYASGLVAPTQQGAQVQPQVQPTSTPAGKYNVISVTKLHGRWSAVMGVKGKLYQVAVDQMVPGSDDWKIVDIDDNGVVVQDKTGKTKRYELVSII